MGESRTCAMASTRRGAAARSATQPGRDNAAGARCTLPSRAGAAAGSDALSACIANAAIGALKGGRAPPAGGPSRQADRHPAL